MLLLYTHLAMGDVCSCECVFELTGVGWDWVGAVLECRQFKIHIYLETAHTQVGLAWVGSGTHSRGSSFSNDWMFGEHTYF